MPNAVAQKRKTMLAAPTIAGRSAGRVTVRSTCHGEAPERGGGLPGPRVERLPRDPDGPDHDGDVEEDEPADDRDRRAVEAEEAERAALPQQLAEGDADDDRRQHERHQQRGAHRRRPGSASRCRAYAAGSPSSDGEQRSRARRSTP